MTGGSMRTLPKAIGLACCMLFGALMPVRAQQECVASPGVLGVSRTVELDAASAPRFGSQYQDSDLLAEGEVVLTFDDGPLRAYTRPVIEALSAQCVKATFFMVGRMAVADPEMVQEVARRGHTVGIHTWSHAKLSALSPQRARAEIELGFSAVRQALGQPVAPFFRFPYLADSAAMLAHLKARQAATFSIDVDSKDFRTRDPAHVHHRVMMELARKRKGIILFHDIQPSTARALPGLLAELKGRGYRVVHLRPKELATTLAEFDALAQHQINQRGAAAQGQPMARRAFTWPAAGGAEAQVADARQRAPARRARSQRPSKGGDIFSSILPW